MSACAAKLAPSVAAASLMQSGSLVAATNGASRVVQPCPCSPALRPDPATRKAIDNKVICSVMCCCDESPGIGADGRSLMQQCADGVFKSADALLGSRSRYKSEISYNMHLDDGGPPTPFMSRTGTGTEPSAYWQGRAKAEIENYGGGKGMVRRPDLTIVDDPCQPPVAGNIESVAELKFGDDARSRAQDEAYRGIAGSPGKYQVFRAGGAAQGDEHECDCDEERKRQPQTVPVPQPQSQEDALRKTAANAAKAGGVAAALMALGAAAAAIAEYAWPLLLAL